MQVFIIINLSIHTKEKQRYDEKKMLEVLCENFFNVVYWNTLTAFA